MAKKAEIISEYEAASITYMSPDLLRWLTSHAPKSGIVRKLKVAKKEDDIFFFDRREVLAFDAWLKQPWPRKNGSRPGIPVGIQREIKMEANGACAICQGHKDTCEAAHLDPVAKSDNNHPENLLWLCSDHHTAYDKGLFGPAEGEDEFVAGFKTSLRRYKVMLWRMQAELSFKVLSALENCQQLHKQLSTAKTEEQVEAIAAVAKDILDNLPALAPISRTDPRYKHYQSVSTKIGVLAKSKEDISQRLSNASNVRNEYVAALGMVSCPLCNASGRHDGNDCPVCNGDREIEKHDAETLDLTQFLKVDCPLCDGEGQHEHGTCPVCGGEGDMESRFADFVDVGDYQRVQCPLCEGAGKLRGDDCPACQGESEMERRFAAQVELRDYEMAECPLCEGEGKLRGDDCPACQGESEMERRFAAQFELRD
jgi:hypothetical protein